MKKAFVDTNIVIDLLAKREPFYKEAAVLFSLADGGQIELSVSTLTIANINYILLEKVNAAKAKAILRGLKMVINVLSLDNKIVDLALNDESFSDFEDGLQYFTALENKQEFIITRNLKDFKYSKLPTMTARQFINL